MNMMKALPAILTLLLGIIHCHGTEAGTTRKAGAVPDRQPASAAALASSGIADDQASAQEIRRHLYVAVPGLRRYPEFGGHGLLVFDIEDNHRFLKRIPVAGLLRKPATFPQPSNPGTPSNVKGIAASLAYHSIYISNLETMQRVCLETEQVVWEREYEGGADRMAISPDGKLIYLPSLEKEHWHAVDAETGKVIARVESGNSGAHNTIFGLDGREVYLAGLRSKTLGVIDPRTHTVIRQVGPFSAPIRPFTINGAQTLAYVNVNGLLGFEIGDLKTGEFLHRIDVTEQGFKAIAPLRHGVFSHGVGLTPDEKEVWVVDGANRKFHIYDNTIMPPRYLESISLRAQPGWITFSLDGRHAYAPTGEVVDVASRKIITQLRDEHGVPIKSEKMLEAHVTSEGKIVRAGDQFGLGRVRP
jgi:DNA-binding beta-propeller fold protein YncE